MISVLLRELSALPIFKSQKLFNRIANIVFAVFSIAAIIAVETFIYCKVYENFKIYKGVNQSLTAILLFCFFIASIFVSLSSVSRCFFDKKDRAILSPLPVSFNDVFLSKSIYCYLRCFAFILITSFPILIAYGVLYNSLFVFYILAFLYVVNVSFMSLGAVSLLSFPFYFFSSWIKRNTITLIVVSFAIMLGLTFLYSYVLDLFVSVVSGNSINSLLSVDFVEKLSGFGNALYPFMTIIKSAGLGARFDIVLELIFIPLGVYAVATPVLYFSFLGFTRTGGMEIKGKKKALIKPLKKPLVALMGKELAVLSSSSDGIFSFFPLVLASPFLVISVVQGVDAIFHVGNLNYVEALFPGFSFFIEVLLIFLFLSVLNGSGGLSLRKEGEATKLMKQFPISGKRQLLIKMAVPFACSSITFLISVLVLGVRGNLSYADMGYVMASGILYLASLYLAYVISELKWGGKSGFLLAFISFLAPVIFAALPALLTLIDSSYSAYSYPILLGLSTILFIPFAFIFVFRGERMFLSYEGVRA